MKTKKYIEKYMFRLANDGSRVDAIKEIFNKLWDEVKGVRPSNGMPIAMPKDIVDAIKHANKKWNRIVSEYYTYTGKSPESSGLEKDAFLNYAKSIAKDVFDGAVLQSDIETLLTGG